VPLIQSCRDNVKFCIICNYISKIDEPENEFINIRFNQLPQDYTLNFIKNSNSGIRGYRRRHDTIQKIYETDIRSTINFIQLNRALKQEEWKFKILNDEVFQYIHFDA
jgi:DNA polymerase III delta prime subunit